MRGWGSADFQGGFTSETTDGGQTWVDANHVGKFLNRFRFFGDPVTVGYASGLTVYKYAAEPVGGPGGAALGGPAPATRFLAGNEPSDQTPPVQVAVTVPEAAASLTVDIWDRFGERVRRLVDDAPPEPGAHTIE